MTDRPRISQDASDRARKAKKRREVAFIIPFIGLILFSSPLLDALGVGSSTAQNRYFALFLIWGLLILGAFVTSRMLKPEIEKS